MESFLDLTVGQDLDHRDATGRGLDDALLDEDGRADIVAGVCHAVPKQYESIAVAASMGAPESGKEILLAVGFLLEECRHEGVQRRLGREAGR